MHRQLKATAAFIIFVSARPPFTQPFSKMRNLLSFFMLPLLVLVLVNKIGTHTTHNKTQPDPRSTQDTLTNLPTWCTNKVKITTQHQESATTAYQTPSSSSEPQTRYQSRQKKILTITLALFTTTPMLRPAVVRQRLKRIHPYQDHPQ